MVVVKMSSGRIVTGAEGSALMKSGEKTDNKNEVFATWRHIHEVLG